MQSFAVVEQPSFIRLINGLQPTKKVLGRKALVSNVEKRYVNMKEMLSAELSPIQYVCTTADIWSAHNRSFFGITAHWIEKESLTRKSAALSCLRFRGKHTYDAIATILEQVHLKFGITGKVVLTVTDNGSNFIKAFKEFGKQSTENESDEPMVQAEDGSSATTDEELDNAVYVDMQAIIQNPDSAAESEYTLPPHRPCASHTINLIGTRDALKATADAAYKKVYYSTMAKCSALWNKVSRSVQSAEILHDELQTALIVPNDTRWNSHYDAVDKIRHLLTTAETKFRTVCDKLGLPAFRLNEMSFLTEFCSVMKPVANALDILQGERNCYLGVLLPTLISLRNKVSQLKDQVRYATPLIKAVLDGIESRFGSWFNDDDLTLAAVTLPQFRLRWCANDECKERARNLLKREMSHMSMSAENDEPTATAQSNEDTDEEFFAFNQTASVHNSSSSVQQEMELYLSDETKQLESLKKFPTVKAVFLKYNTPIPSSAPVERLFSTGGQILTPRRCRMSDEHFEMLLLLNSNKSLK